MTPDARVAELLTTFDAADLDLGSLLCDRHPADDVAFTGSWSPTSRRPT